MNIFRSYISLCRLGISALAACSAATGYVLSSRHPSATALVPVAGVFLLACGSSALNQVQERKTDALMERTRRRPVPSGVMSPLHAISLSLILATSGLSLLGASGTDALIFGLFALLWYNGFYTYLKKKTAFAAVPGALIGSVPPAIGWVSAGGTFLDPGLVALCSLFFLWQVPHFWLLVLRHGDEYVKAGLPALTNVFSRRQIGRLVFVWTFAVAATTLTLPLYGIARARAGYFLPVFAVVLVAAGAALLFRKDDRGAGYAAAFRTINAFLFFVMLTLTLDVLYA